MMQDCPRCGFVQPEDRYCANCGLDIENYSPAKPGVLKQFTQNSGVLLSVLVLALVGIIAGLYIHQSKQIDERLEGPAIEPEAPTVSKRQNTQPRPASPSPPKAKPAQTIKQEPVVKPGEAESLNAIAPEKQNTESEATASPTELEVRFAEFNKNSLDELLSSGQVISESSSERTATVPSTGSEFSSKTQGLTSLSGGETRKLSINDPLNFEFISAVPGQGEGAPEEELGLSLQIMPSNISGDSITVEVTGLISVREADSGNVISVDLNGSYNFSSKETLVISGFVPHQKIPEDDVNYFSGSPLTILSSEAFLNNNTEFLIILQAK